MNIIDELFIVAPPESVRAVVCDPVRWAGWLPGVRLTPYDDRGCLGVRWAVSGELAGTAEVWLEEHGDGTIVHAYLRADPSETDLVRGDARWRLLGRRPGSRRWVEARYVFPLKRQMLAVKDLLEGDRLPGTSRVALGERVVSASEDRQVTRRPRPRRPTGPGSEGAAPDGRPDHLEHRDRR